MGARPDALTAAIEQAWQVFDLPAPADLGICTAACCMDPKLEAEILATPARDLTAHHIQEWRSSAACSNLSAGQVQWLLPRMFELLAEHTECSPLDPEIILSRLPDVGFPDSWTEPQVKAVHDFCMALLDRKLADHDEAIDIWLCMIAGSHLDMAPFLDRIWALPDSDFAALLLANWVGNSDRGWIFRTEFWADCPARTQVWNWYTSPELVRRLYRMGRDGDPRLLELAADVGRFEGRPLSP